MILSLPSTKGPWNSIGPGFLDTGGIDIPEHGSCHLQHVLTDGKRQQANVNIGNSTIKKLNEGAPTQW